MRISAGRVARATFGVFGSTSAWVGELSDTAATLARPLPLVRRINFVQLHGGAGASAIAGHVASTLARRRAGMVLGVNASSGPIHLLWHAGLAGDAEQLEAARRAEARTAEDARAGLPTTRTGLIGLDLTREVAAPGAVSDLVWADRVGPIARFYDVICTDWGVRDPRVDLRRVVETGHVLCLVTRADRHAAEEAAGLIPAVRAVDERVRVVLVLADVNGAVRDRASASPRALRRLLDVDVHLVPYQPRRAAARPVGSDRLPARHRRNLLRLTALLMTDDRPHREPVAAPTPAPAEPTGPAADDTEWTWGATA